MTHPHVRSWADVDSPAPSLQARTLNYSCDLEDCEACSLYEYMMFLAPKHVDRWLFVGLAVNEESIKAALEEVVKAGEVYLGNMAATLNISWQEILEGPVGIAERTEQALAEMPQDLQDYIEMLPFAQAMKLGDQTAEMAEMVAKGRWN